MHRTQHMDQQANLQQKQAADARKAEQDQTQRADDEHRGVSAARLDPLAFSAMQAMLGNTSSAASVQIGAADSEGNPDVGNHEEARRAQLEAEARRGDESEDADMHRTQQMDLQANLQQKQAADARKAEQAFVSLFIYFY